MLMKTKYNILKKVRTTLFVIIIQFFSIALFSQEQGSIWYFGSNAGLDFNTNPPTVLSDGQLNTLEGTASIADENGNLMFYTDGVSLYTTTHSLMPNGQEGLGGNSSSAQSALIVPYPGSSNLFLIFAVSEYINSDLVYSLLDMNLNKGLGDIVENHKAIPVLNGTGEYIQATPSADGSFWWVLTHKSGTSDYYAYKVTQNGVDINNPVISSTGTVSSALGNIGFIKFNNLGSRVVRTSYTQHHFDISTFDNVTGQVSNTITLPFQAAYGAEFSPNNRFLYISGYSNQGVKQYDLEAGNTAAQIQASVFTLSNLVNGAIQIAPNGKIYSSRYGATALDVIHQPNQPGVLAQFVLNSQPLGSASAQLGLPNIITNLVSQAPPKLQQLSVSNITDNSGTLQVLITSDGGSTIIERGFYFGTDTLSIENEITVPGEMGQMVLELESLQPQTTYYFGAYATNQHGTTHLNWESFTTLTEIDTIPPVAICFENIVLELDEFGFAYLTSEMVDNGSFDNDAIAEIYIDITEFGCSDIGENIVTLTVIDQSGNSSTCTTVVLVEDNIAPEIFIELESNIQQITNNQPYTLPDYFLNGSAFALDNCTTIVTDLEQTPLPGTLLEAGTYLIILSASDEFGNTSILSFEIIVETLLGTTDFTSDFDLIIHPNPTTDYFKISNSNEFNFETISIFDLNGRLLNKIDYNDYTEINKINVKHLAASTYLIVIQGEGKSTVKKLIKI